MLHTLIALWAVLDLLLLGASVLCIVASTAWRQTDVLISLVFMPRHFNGPSVNLDYFLLPLGR